MYEYVPELDSTEETAMNQHLRPKVTSWRSLQIPQTCLALGTGSAFRFDAGKTWWCNWCVLNAIEQGWSRQKVNSCLVSEQPESQGRRTSSATARQSFKSSWRDESTATVPSGLHPRLRRGLDHVREVICNNVRLIEFVGGLSTRFQKNTAFTKPMKGHIYLLTMQS